MVAKAQHFFLHTTAGLEAGWGTLAVFSALDGDRIFWLRDHGLHIRIFMQDWQKFFLLINHKTFKIRITD